MLNSGKNIQLSLREVLKQYNKVFKRIHCLLIGKTVIFLISREDYDQEEILKLSQKAKFEREIEELINKSWLEV